MTLPSHHGAHPGMDPPPGRPARLTSWKEIAAYFDRDVRTVQLWEKNEGLPVHRLEHIARSSVYAYPQELERWLADRRRDHAGALPAAQPELASYPQPLAFPSSAGHAARPHPHTLRWSAAAALALAAVAGGLLWRLHPRPAPATEITVVLADFVNTTKEPAFDNVLNTALSAKLQQTPFLNLMPDSRIHTALRYMRLPAQERLTQDIARQVCLREGGQVVLQGSIASEDNRYKLTLQASSCSTGRALAERSFLTDIRGSALAALDQAADAVRADLGESAASLHKFDVPIEDASTPSLEALTAYSQGLQLSNIQGEFAAEPYFVRAAELDPGFAIAYARLSSIYWDKQQPDRAARAAQTAYEKRDRVSEWEKFFILSSYYAFTTGELDKERDTYREWGAMYPHDTVWPTGLSIDEAYFGNFEQSIALQRRQLENDPDTAAGYGNLALTYLALERPDEARAALDQADRAHLYEINLDYDRYWLAFYDGDDAAMEKILSTPTSHPGVQQERLAYAAETEAYRGRLRASGMLVQRASAEAQRSGDAEAATLWQEEQALWEAYFGQRSVARADALKLANAPKQGKISRTVAALTFAIAGDAPHSQAVAEALYREHPLDTLLNQYWLAVVRAQTALDQGHAQLALDQLQSAAPYDTALFDTLPCMFSVYTRGQAYLALHRPQEAAASFRNVLAHRGLVLNCPTGALSRLGLARALAAGGDAAGSRSAYQDLFALWKNADPGLALLRQAQTEYRSLDR